MKYWKDIDDYKNNDLHNANPVKSHEEEISLFDLIENESTSSRRDFLKIFGFSIASASVLSSCEKPVTKAIPYLIQPETVTPGESDYYASTFYDGEQYGSILVKVRDGRPIKIEGNDLSRLSQGSTSPIVQASVLELYDDNRIRQPMINLQESTWEAVDAGIVEKLQAIKTRGGKIALLSSSIISPSTLKVIDRFKKEYPGLKHTMYDPVSVSGIREAHEITFGLRAIPGYQFDKANVIVSFNADFLGNWLAPNEFARSYISRRKLDDGQKSMSRHIQVETNLSMTGSNADERISIRPSEEKMAVAHLYHELLNLSGQIPGTTLPDMDPGFKSIAGELYENRGQSLVISGSNDTEVQVLINSINNLLGNYGQTLDLNDPILTKKGNDKELKELVEEINTGEIDGILFYHVNPAFDFPIAGEIKKGIENIELSVSFSNTWDETAVLVDYICPDHHYLESWNDANPRIGHYSLCQPVISPIFDTRQVQDSLLRWSGDETAYLELIKEFWNKELFPASTGHLNFTDFWNHSLQDGFFESGNNKQSRQPRFRPFSLNGILESLKSSGGGDLVELHLYESNIIGTGKHTNNPWLQETPDPISKICWDNYAAVSPLFAEDQLLKTGDVILIDKNLEIPILIQPGQKYGTISIALGYGKEVTGKAASGIGANGYSMIDNRDGQRIYHRFVDFTKTGKKHELAMTQSHHSMEGRPIIRETNLEAYLENPSAGNEIRENILKHLDSPYEKHNYEGHHWGMVIDLNSCIGCNACVVACTSENNVPVVGREEVKKSREMHWIRIDRYYSGDPENPSVHQQPVMCQHCDNAPCENVCPVAATTHSSEGLNQMTYNRCIGTRYCNNNCPYKVRRFNWFDYNKADSLKNNTVDAAGMTLDLSRMVLNPDVTLRAKGVMEKCTFCVQRIEEKRLKAKLDRRMLNDGEIKTACQQVCPGQAIVFGDMNDESSKVSKLMKDQRTYHLLEELHTLPSVGYLTKIKNKTV
ncbi:MAG: 4Fe-4S dicluster domain-containing protein [Bacteroidales bacterium]